MTAQAGRHTLGPDRGRVLLRTYREGLAASVGHDLVIEFGYWSTAFVVDEDAVVTQLTAVLDLTSLKVVGGVGGVKPLSDRDRRDIVSNARRQLAADRVPEARFTATSFSPDADGGGAVTGTLSLAGAQRPLTLHVAAPDGDHYRATGQVVQSEFGIKPYSGFFGALKLRDAVDVEIEVDV